MQTKRNKKKGKNKIVRTTESQRLYQSHENFVYPILTVPPKDGPIPPAIRVRMTFATSGLLIPGITTGNVGNQVYRMNSVYDPDKTGSGEQPFYFDSFAALYNRYRVIGCSYVLNASSTSNSSWCVRMLNGTLAPTTIPEADTVIEGSHHRSANSTVVPGMTVKVSDGIKLYSISTIPATYYTDDTYAGTGTTNPNEVMDLVIALNNFSSSTVSLQGTLVIYYDVLWSDPLVVSESYATAIVARMKKIYLARQQYKQEKESHFIDGKPCRKYWGCACHQNKQPPQESL